MYICRYTGLNVKINVPIVHFVIKLYIHSSVLPMIFKLDALMGSVYSLILVITYYHIQVSLFKVLLLTRHHQHRV